ncbi:MAG: ECF transporter S component, partial [Leuconostoc falkenbergense]
LTAFGFTVMHTNFTGIPNHNLLGWLVSLVSFNSLFEVITGVILVTFIGNVIVPMAQRAGLNG